MKKSGYVEVLVKISLGSKLAKLDRGFVYEAALDMAEKNKIIKDKLEKVYKIGPSHAFAKASP